MGFRQVIRYYPSDLCVFFDGFARSDFESLTVDLHLAALVFFLLTVCSGTKLESLAYSNLSLERVFLGYYEWVLE